MSEYMTPEACDKKHKQNTDKLDVIQDTLVQVRLDVAKVSGEVKAMDVRINGTQEKFKDHILQGNFWRGTIVALCISLVSSVFAGAIWAGKLTAIVMENQRRGIESHKLVDK
jgi:hypothetical protein